MLAAANPYPFCSVLISPSDVILAVWDLLWGELTVFVYAVASFHSENLLTR